MLPMLGILGVLGFLLFEGLGLSGSYRATPVKSAALPVAEAAVNLGNPPNLSRQCQAISGFDRTRLTSWAGVDVVGFVESTTRILHAARSTEERLRVIAARFDHLAWSTAWSQGQMFPSVSARANENLRLQTDLNHSSLFLSRYGRLIENGKSQEAAALRAFAWEPSVAREFKSQPMRTVVQSYLPHICTNDDARQYGCFRGETMYRVSALVSPRIACRFNEKQEQYTAVYWVRIKRATGGRFEARIMEVEANGERLVKLTYDDLQSRKLLSVLSPSMTRSLMEANLDPFRAPILWRRWTIEPTRRPASHR